MYDKCESCGKNIEDSDDLKLFSHDGETTHTYCDECYKNRDKKII